MRPPILRASSHHVSQGMNITNSSWISAAQHPRRLVRMVDGGLPMDPWKSCWHHPPGIYGMADELIIVFENVGIQTLGVSSWIQSIIMIACWHQIEMVDTHGAFTAHLRCKCQQICFSCRPISDWFHKPRLIDARCQPPEKWSYAIKHIIKLDDWVAHSLGHPGFNLHPPRYPKGSVSCTAASELHGCKAVQRPVNTWGWR